MKTVIEDRRFSHRWDDDDWYLELGLAFQGKVFGDGRPNAFGDQRTSCFTQTQSGLVNGLRV